MTAMKKIFTKLGATPKEADLFLRLLELGAQPASVVAKHIGSPRSTTYLMLENLIKIGLVMEFERFGVKYFKCIPANQIGDLIRGKQHQWAQTEEEYQELLPELSKKENTLSVTPKIRFFEGKEKVLEVYEQILKEKEFSALFNPQLVKEFMPEYHDLIPKTLRKEGGKARELLVDGPEAQKYQKTYSSRSHQIRLLPERMSFASDVIICPEKMYMISYGEKQITATEIMSPQLIETQQALFEELWEQAK